MEKTKSIYVKEKKSKIHGTGIYATRDIPKNTYVLEYVGEKVTKKQSDQIAQDLLDKYEKNKKKYAGVFLFTLNSRFDINGNVKWNTARFINHSCDPNSEAVIDKGHIWIETIKNVKKGDEITYNYGYDVENYEDHPCWCGTKKCVSYIVAEKQWTKLKKLLKKKLSK
ncbi:SET domain-containing protein-lysine N-methyltransferase [Candidatus Woesearchaeota archaeon]|jgi:uncharacterized protein|nr:SET domain-containing protein-lysine N-methyltransferase [Candidatus Woesearchaeota archaeon]MBT4387167.1 SET domain-containing protein-lysine N-methyltransferase [Candidatus Woesearchaeota archaeon]MBT4596076.1 SET domain-containing protein-lysine N-methyltransferase [Candidatus Woesearchaeota archaeon]MBT5741702.1 SET domain-containing protein-lysine N-methyltransferase [Candidatus Woesearchaeota archaeon]MBT6506025.1 SET domain-containing protein-lysine N-methyltransferase [Candidatus Woe